MLVYQSSEDSRKKDIKSFRTPTIKSEPQIDFDHLTVDWIDLTASKLLNCFARFFFRMERDEIKGEQPRTREECFPGQCYRNNIQLWHHAQPTWEACNNPKHAVTFGAPMVLTLKSMRFPTWFIHLIQSFRGGSCWWILINGCDRLTKHLCVKTKETTTKPCCLTLICFRNLE